MYLCALIALLFSFRLNLQLCTLLLICYQLTEKCKHARITRNTRYNNRFQDKKTRLASGEVAYWGELQTCTWTSR